MPALRRPTLCTKHSKGHREDEIDGVRPPVGASTCPLCAAEAAEKIAARDTGTRTVTRLPSDPDTSYAPQSERGRDTLAAFMTARERERLDADEAVALLDAERPDVIALDHARAGRERIDVYRRQRRLSRAPRPRWIT